ncbi:MAG: oligosaccharide flippase family protein [Anaerolineae bacterium]
MRLAGRIWKTSLEFAERQLSPEQGSSSVLLKHSGVYFLALALPGVLSFLAVAVFTRLLSPGDYGRYALVVAGVAFVNAVFFHWIRVSVARFLPAHLHHPVPFVNNLFAVYSGIALITGAVGISLALCWPDPAWRLLILLAVPLLWVQSWFELNLTLMSAKLRPIEYGLMNMIKAVGALGLGAGMVALGLGAFGALAGLLLGFLLASAGFTSAEWRGVKPAPVRSILTEMLRYGLPLTATYLLTFVVSTSDRFLVAAMIGDGAAGVYSASYDLGQQALVLIMTVVSLAGYPLVVRALEQDGRKAADQHLRRNATLLLGISVPATVGLVLLAPSVARFALGEQFRETAESLIPVVAVGTFLAGIRNYYFDLSFHLGRRTVRQMWAMGASAILNFTLNLWWIPVWGLMGAAYATLAAYFVAFVLSVVLGNRVFPLPFPYKDAFKILAASGTMGLIVWLIPQYKEFQVLALQVLGGGLVYLFVVGLLDVASCRTKALRRLRS